MSDSRDRTFGPDSPESRAIAEARHNAQMLYEDAKLLFENRRWATSISLSILACEEVGKFLILNYSLGTQLHEVGALRVHKDKQAEFSRYLQSILRVRALDEYFRLKGEADFEKRMLAALTFLDKCLVASSGAEDSMDAVSSHPELGPIKAITEEKMRNDPAYELARQAALGQLDAVKQQGFYVDVKEGGFWCPRSFSEQEASLYLRAAMLVVTAVAPECRSPW